MIHAAVPQLPGQPPLERLDVGDDRLGFDHEPPIRTADPGIPGTQVPLDRQWHLGPPPQSRTQVAPQPLEQPRLSGVPNWVPGWESVQAQVEPDRRRDACLELEVSDPSVGVEDPPDRRGIDAAGTADIPIAQPAASPGGIDVFEHPLLVRRHPTSCPGDASVPNAHRREVSQRAVHRRLSHGRATDARCVARGAVQSVPDQGAGPRIPVVLRPVHDPSPQSRAGRHNVRPTQRRQVEDRP